MSQHHGTADAGAVALHLGSDGKVHDLAALNLPHGGAADGLIGIGAGTAPDGIAGAFGSRGGHGGGGDAAELGFGHAGFDVLEDGLEARFGSSCRGPQAGHFGGAFFHEDGPDQCVRGDHVLDPAHGPGEFRHHDVGEKIPGAETDFLKFVLGNYVVPLGQGRAGVLRLRGFPEVHQLDDFSDPGAAGSEGERLRADDEGGGSFGGDQHRRRLETGPVVGKIPHRRRFRFGGKNENGVEAVFAHDLLRGVHPAVEFLRCQNRVCHKVTSFSAPGPWG